jgi:hypothetical protein
MNPEITITGTEKRPRNDGSGSNMVDLRVFSQRPAITRQVSKPEQDPQVKKFKEVVREAEKSTLIFNLNMGTVPIVNQDTMSTKVTKALSDRAAQVDGLNRSIPCEDTTLSLDDVLSVVKGMKFYGKSTKTYRNPRDHLEVLLLLSLAEPYQYLGTILCFLSQCYYQLTFSVFTTGILYCCLNAIVS